MHVITSIGGGTNINHKPQEHENQNFKGEIAVRISFQDGTCHRVTCSCEVVAGILDRVMPEWRVTSTSYLAMHLKHVTSATPSDVNHFLSNRFS